MKKEKYITSFEFPSSSFIIKLVNFTSEIPPPESIGTGSVRKCSSISKMLIKKKISFNVFDSNSQKDISK